MSDPYIHAADHLALLSESPWKALHAPLTEALAPVADRSGRAVEIGAGTGISTAAMAEALPLAQLHVVEPSDHLRSALMHRVSSTPGLRTRTTVEHRRFPEAPLPEPFDALLMINALGHLTPAERDSLWSTVASGLTPGGVAVVNLQPPAAPVPVDEFELGKVRVGAREYHGTAWAEPAGDAEVFWHMTYLTSVDSTVIDRREVTYVWHVVDVDRLFDELTARALTADLIGPASTGMYRITRQRRPSGA